MPTYLEPTPDVAFTPEALLAACIESGAEGLLLDAAALPAEFFDLSTHLAGELLHALSKYRLRLAAVVEDPARHSAAFQDFARELGAGRQFRLFPTRAAAIAWLEQTGA